MKRLFLWFCLISASAQAQTIDELKILKHMESLGKSKNTNAYIVKEFKKIGLKSFGDFNNLTLNVNNIGGYIDNKQAYTLIVGAENSNDNLSGLASLLELSRYYSENKKNEAYNLLFVAYKNAEDINKTKFINSDKINGFINLDKIGSYNEEEGLLIGGVSSSSAFEKWGPELGFCMEFTTKIDSTVGTQGGQIAFYNNQIPVLYLNTPAKSEVNYKGVKLISNYVIQLISHLEELPKMDYRKL